MKGILIDVTRCRGCNRCAEACALANDLPGDPAAARFGSGELSSDRFTTLVSLPQGRTAKVQCMHCIDPACAAACLVGALQRTPEGQVVYDADKCIGCRYCMLACPLSIPRYEWDTTHPLVRKCEMCHDRPGGPACVAACPYDATLWDDRDELRRVARDRIDADPDLYLPRIWGETEAGGTAVLYISDVPLDEIWPESLGPRSVPEITWPVVKTTPYLAAGVLTALSALSFIVHRRDRLAAERGAGTGEEEQDRDTP